MRILTRYVLREYIVPLFYCLSGFISIYILFELVGSFSRLAEAKLPWTTVISYFCGYLAPFFHYLAPAALMLAALYTMWSFCRHSELVAMRASGIGFLTIVKPILFVAFLLAAFVGWVNECYVPVKAQWAKRLRAERFEMEKLARTGDMVYRNTRDHRTWSISRAEDEYGEHLADVKVTVDRANGGRLMNVTAAHADYMDGEWWFTEPKIQHYDVNGHETVSPTPELDALKTRAFPEFSERPSDFVAQNIDWQYVSVRDKLRYLHKHKFLPEDQKREYRYDAWAQALSPFACIVIVLFAIPAGIASGRQSVFKGILGAIGMFFAFYSTVIGCMVFARLGWMPAIPAAILPHAVFLVVAVKMFRAQR